MTQQSEIDSRSSEFKSVFYLPKRLTEAKLGSTKHQVDLLADCYSKNTELEQQ